MKRSVVNADGGVDGTSKDSLSGARSARQQQSRKRTASTAELEAPPEVAARARLVDRDEALGSSLSSSNQSFAARLLSWLRGDTGSPAASASERLRGLLADLAGGRADFDDVERQFETDLVDGVLVEPPSASGGGRFAAACGSAAAGGEEGAPDAWSLREALDESVERLRASSSVGPRAAPLAAAGRRRLVIAEIESLALKVLPRKQEAGDLAAGEGRAEGGAGGFVNYDKHRALRELIESHLARALYRDWFAGQAEMVRDVKLSNALEAVAAHLTPAIMGVDKRFFATAGDADRPWAYSSLRKADWIGAAIEALSGACATAHTPRDMLSGFLRYKQCLHRGAAGALGRPGGADDMCGLAMFFLAGANVPHLHSALTFVSFFRDPYSIPDEEGYVIVDLMANLEFLEERLAAEPRATVARFSHLSGEARDSLADNLERELRAVGRSS